MERLIAALREEQCVLFEKSKNLFDYTNLANRFHVFINKNIAGDVRDERDLGALSAIIENPLLKDESMALSYHAKTFFYNILSVYYGRNGDTEKELYYTNRLVELIEKNIVKERGRNFNYIIALINLLVVQKSLMDYRGFYYTLNKLKNIKDYIPNELTEWDRALIFCFADKEELMVN